MSSLKLRISTPVQPIPHGLGFYQIEEESLHVQLGGGFEFRRFFSYIDSPVSRFDLDRQGHLMFLELPVSKRQWEIVEELPSSEMVEPADIRWLVFRKSIAAPKLFTDQNHSRLLVQFSDEPVQCYYYLADSVIVQVSACRNAVGIMINEIVNDSAGKKIAQFRRALSGNSTAAAHWHKRDGSAAAVS